MTWQNDSDPMISGKKKTVIERYNRDANHEKKMHKKRQRRHMPKCQSRWRNIIGSLKTNKQKNLFYTFGTL